MIEISKSLVPPVEILSFVQRHVAKVGNYDPAEKQHLTVVPVLAQPVDKNFQPIAAPRAVVTRDISSKSVGLVHTTPFRDNLLALQMLLGDEQVNLVVELQWSMSLGTYHYSGGRIVSALAGFPNYSLVASDLEKSAVLRRHILVVDDTGDKDRLGNAINRMIGNLRDVVSQANKIAEGDYSADIAPSSDNDELGVALNEMTKTLRDVVDITEAVSVGDYSGSIKIKSNNDLLGYAINQMIATVRDSTAQQQAIVAASLDPLITIDARGIVQSASDSVERVFGYSLEEVIGKNINLLMPEPYGSEHDGYLEEYSRTGQSSLLGTTRKLVAKRKNGEEFPCEVSVSRVDLPDRDEPLFTGTIRDISERKKADNKLREQADSLIVHTMICQSVAEGDYSLNIDVRYRRTQLPPTRTGSAVS